MKTVQLDIDDSTLNRLMKWIYKQPEESFKINYIVDSSKRFDENGIEYVDAFEQKEIEERLKNPDTKTVGHSKTVSLA